jgi:hypothetical protein
MQSKKLKLAIAVIVIIAVVTVVYFAFFYYDNSTDNIQLSFGTSYLKQIPRGSQVEEYVYADFDSRDEITLSFSGGLASHFRFIKHVDNGLAYVSQITINGKYSGANMLIRIPEYIETGNYEITVIGSNSAGVTATLLYEFEVTD